MRFQHQVVAITGAAGIGRQTAEQAAREGARLLLIDRSRYVHELAATLAEGQRGAGAGGGPRTVGEHRAGFAAGVAHFGRLDVVINNIGGTIWARPFAEYQPDQIEKRFVVRCFRRYGRARRYRGCSNRARAASLTSRPSPPRVNRVPYSAAKGGVNALTRSIAMEYSGAGFASTPWRRAEPRPRRA